MPVPTNGRTVLLREEDLEVRSYLETALRCQGYKVQVAETGEEMLTALDRREEPVAAVVIDTTAPCGNGFDPLKEIRRAHGHLPLIAISSGASRLTEVHGKKNEAVDYMANPVHPQDVRKALQSVIGNNGTVAEAPRAPAAAPLNKQAFFGTAPKIRELQNLITQIGWSEAPVLIQGETGSGKEVFAREIHARSPRAKRTMLKLNCAALPSELVESELFGYERGAFTGAFQKKLGMFELADGSTIMLDEIGDMELKLQAKLLQVLQDQEFQRLGGKESIRVDVRVIAATHRNLESAIAEGKFREDLFYRLNVVNLQVPPLRERREDILPLAAFLARKHTPAGSPPVQFPPLLQELMLRHPWPGNIRQLENTVRRFLIIGDSGLSERDLNVNPGTTPASPAEPAPTAPPVPATAEPSAHGTNGVHQMQLVEPPGATSVLQQVAKAKREAERSAILATLNKTNWNRRRAAVLLQVEYKALLYKMKVLDIRKEKSEPQKAKAAAL